MIIGSVRRVLVAPSKGFSLLASTALLVAGASSATAVPLQAVTVGDGYYGGFNYYNNNGPGNANNPPPAADVIGDPSKFDIISARFERSLDLNTLTVTITTNYAGNNGLFGTAYGSLFFAPTSSWTPTVPAPYSTDVYKPGQWTSAFAVNGTNGNLYSTGENPTAVPSGNPNVALSYTTSTGSIGMSNAYGNPVSYGDSPGAAGYYFRERQAVTFTPLENTPILAGTGTGGHFAVGVNTLTFTIIDNHVLGDTFAFSWAMTCANDVIQGLVDLRSNSNPPPGQVPVPAALPLFASALGVLGLVNWRRKRRPA